MRIKVFLFFFVLASCISSKTLPDPTETVISHYYFIRHAEKDESNESDKNPHLTSKGQKRAKNWSKILGNEKIDLVYSTNYHRTRETAAPVAIKNNTKIAIYNPSDIDYESFLKETSGKNILIVGHSNTTPAFVNNVIGNKKYKNIEHKNFGNLYIVTIINNKISSQLLTFN